MLDFILLTLCDEKNEKLFNKLVNKYLGFITKVAHNAIADKTEAEEAIQDALVTIFVNLKFFRGNDDEKNKTYVFRIIKTRCLDIRKKYRRFEQVLPLTDNEVNTYDEQPDEILESNEAVEIIIGAVKKLPAKYSTVLRWALIDQLDARDISRIMNIPVSTVYTRLSRGKAKLIKILKEVYSFEWD